MELPVLGLHALPAFDFDYQPRPLNELTMPRTLLHEIIVRRAWLAPLLLATAGAVGWACQQPGSGAADEGPDTDLRRDVLASIAHRVIVPQTEAFATAAEDLRDAVVAQEQAPSTEARGTSQSAWSEAMTQAQFLEVMQVGPAAASLSSVAGEDLRDPIYSWPTIDTCSVDRALVEKSYAADDFFAVELVWDYGLDALEYLLFVEAPSHTCPAQVQLDGAWDALGPAEIARRRDAYAARVASEVATQARALARRWSPEGQDFASALADAGDSNSPYATVNDALDEVFAAMFYIDRKTKHDKLGVPLGVIEGCPAAPCTNLMEAPYSGEAAPAIANNLRALAILVQGGPDPATANGFDDLLDAAGEAQIASQLLIQIESAAAMADAFADPLQQQLIADPEAVQGLYDAVDNVSDTLRGPFVMALKLEIPAEGAGDND